MTEPVVGQQIDPFAAVPSYSALPIDRPPLNLPANMIIESTPTSMQSLSSAGKKRSSLLRIHRKRRLFRPSRTPG
jgi:hypothetical protein